MKYNKILKPKKFDNFTIIPSSIFRHKNITVGATGLFAYLFSHKAEQEITIQFICGHFKESKGAIGRKLNELIDAGYIVRERVTDKGKFKGFNYILKAKPKTQKPKPQKPKPQNEPQSNTNNIHTIKSNITQTEKMQNAFPHFVKLFDLRYQPKTTKQKEDWFVCLDRCVRIDKYDLDEIYLAVKSARDDDFWKNNFLTLLKLRNQDKNGIMFIHRFIENHRKYNKPKCFYKIKGIQEYKLYNDHDGSQRLGAITKYNKLNEFNLSQILNRNEIEELKKFVK